MKRYAIAIATMAISLFAANDMAAKRMSDLKIYINPGHGGYTSDDRPIHIYPYAANDSLGYWESKSNLYKGLHMYHILKDLGARPYLSRIKNTQTDDRSLSSISTEANNLGADLFFSIHSNAGENVNYPIMLYRENDLGVPRYAGNVTLSKLLWKNLRSSQLSLWTRDKEYVEGDLTFYQNMWQGGLGVLRGLYTVGLLSEGGMHEHRPEAHRLMNDDFNWLEAWHFVKTIMEYYDVEDKFTTGNVAGVVYDDHNPRELVMPCLFTMFGRDKNAPLNGSLVELIDASGKVVDTRTTDNDYNGVYVFRNIEPGTYTIRASADGYRTRTSQVEVKAFEVSYADMPLCMRRDDPLRVLTCTHLGLTEPVSCSDPLVLTFNYDIDTEAFEQAASFTPEIAGYWTFTEALRKATFRPDIAWEKSTSYTLNIAKSACHTDNEAPVNTLENDFSATFVTRDRGKLELIATYPREGGIVDYRKPSVELRYDAKISYGKIAEQVIVRDKAGNQIPFNTRNCKYNQLVNGFGNAVLELNSNLNVGETYTLSISGDMRDKDDLPLIDNYVISFTAVDQGLPKEGKVIETFEGSNLMAGDAEASVGLATKPSYIRSTSEKIFGSASAKLSYNFSALRGGRARWSYTPAVTPATLFYNGDKIGVHVNGDFNNHALSVELTSGADVKTFALGNLNFKGWNYFVAELDGMIPEQGYAVTGFILDQVGDPVTQKGTFCLDDIVRQETAGIETVTDNHNAGPTIAVDGSGRLIVSGCRKVDRIIVYSPSGQEVARTDGPILSVASLPAGVYVAKILGSNNCVLRFKK